MGPVMWWWRWWLGGDPNRHETEARVLLEQERADRDQMTSSIEERDREIERLRGVVADLERARDDALQARADAEQARTDAEQARAHLTAEAEQARAETERARADADSLRAEVATLRAEVAELTARLEADGPSGASAGPVADDAAEEHVTAGSVDAAAPDVARGSEVLGRALSRDDLTVLEGVGPTMAGVLADAGFDTWRALADADVQRLREVLVEANPRYRMHDPSGWPTQAALLADGRWEEFKQLTAH